MSIGRGGNTLNCKTAWKGKALKRRDHVANDHVRPIFSAYLSFDFYSIKFLYNEEYNFCNSEYQIL